MTVSMRLEIFPIFVEVALLGMLAFLYWLIVVRVIKRERAARKSGSSAKNVHRGCLGG